MGSLRTQMFLSLAARETFVVDESRASRTQGNGIESKIPDANFAFETNVSQFNQIKRINATMFPNLARPLRASKRNEERKVTGL